MPNTCKKSKSVLAMSQKAYIAKQSSDHQEWRGSCCDGRCRWGSMHATIKKNVKDWAKKIEPERWHAPPKHWEECAADVSESNGRPRFLNVINSLATAWLSSAALKQLVLCLFNCVNCFSKSEMSHAKIFTFSLWATSINWYLSIWESWDKKGMQETWFWKRRTSTPAKPLMAVLVVMQLQPKASWLHLVEWGEGLELVTLCLGVEWGDWFWPECADFVNWGAKMFSVCMDFGDIDWVALCIDLDLRWANLFVECLGLKTTGSNQKLKSPLWLKTPVEEQICEVQWLNEKIESKVHWRIHRLNVPPRGVHPSTPSKQSSGRVPRQQARRRRTRTLLLMRAPQRQSRNRWMSPSHRTE